MPTRDWRTVGELLVDSDALARETLVDFSPEAAPAMLRTFVQVTQSATRLWSVLPPTSLAPIPQPELMVRLQAVGRGRSVSLSRWPGQGSLRYEGRTWVTTAQLASNQSLTLPEPVRRGLVDLADDVIATATKAVASSAFLANRRAKTATIASTSSTGRATQARHAVPQQPPEGPRR